MIKKYFGFIFAINFLFGQISDEPFVIGTLPNEGFFSSFISVVSNLMWADANQKVPIVAWNEQSLVYQSKGYNGSKNPWEYYFEPVSDLTYDPRDPKIAVWNMGHAPDDSHLFLSFLHHRGEFHGVAKEKANNIINKYVKIKASIQEKIDAFYNQNIAGKLTIGIHMRGTDSSPNEKVKIAIAEESLKAAEEEAKNYSGEVQFFVATDDEKLLELAKKTLSKKVLYCESHRSPNGKPLHKREICSQRAHLGEELLIEGVLLSKCDFFIHSHSSVPIAVMAFNPDLKTQFIDPMPLIYKHEYNIGN